MTSLESSQWRPFDDDDLPCYTLPTYEIAIRCDLLLPSAIASRLLRTIQTLTIAEAEKYLIFNVNNA